MFHNQEEANATETIKRLIYTSEVSGEGDACGNVRCLRSCVNQIKETGAET